MKRPLFVRPVTEAERAVLEQGLGSRDALILRRSQILLSSAQGQRQARNCLPSMLCYPDGSQYHSCQGAAGNRMLAGRIDSTENGATNI